MARPTKLTGKIQEKICQAIRAGASRRSAAVYAGIGESTFYEWLKRPDYSDFSDALEKAEADCEIRNVGIVQKAASGYDVLRKTVKKKEYVREGATVTETETSEVTSHEFSWQAAAWWLERRRSKDFKLNTGADITSSGEQLPVITFNVVPPAGADLTLA